jgi:hypothetical protein
MRATSRRRRADPGLTFDTAGSDATYPAMAKLAKIAPLPDWSQKFFDPIPLPSRAPLRTLRDAAQYVLALPPAEQRETRWQTAASVLKMVAETGGDPMMARIGMMKALHRREPEAAMMTRRKRVKSFNIVR